MKKRFLSIVICFVILIFIINMLIVTFKEKNSKDLSKIQIITTLYPDYDIASKIVGDKAEVSMLLDAGVEVHTYEPSVKDMKKISDSDMFIYTGDNMEPWVEKLIQNLNNNCVIVDASKNVELLNSEEFIQKYSVLYEDRRSLHNDEEYENHTHKNDGHIWMNPKNVLIMIDTICEKIVELDPQNKTYYEENASKYKKEIEDLDKKIEDELAKNKIDTLVFGGEFAYSYFCERYNLKVATSYTSCGEGAEPSVSRIKAIIDFIKENNISKVFYEELSTGTVANMISEETEAEAKVFNTLQNVSEEEIKKNISYVDIMKKNLEMICK